MHKLTTNKKFNLTNEQRASIIEKLYESQTELSRLAELRMALSIFNTDTNKALSETKLVILNQIINEQIDFVVGKSISPDVEKSELDAHSIPETNQTEIAKLIRQNRVYLKYNGIKTIKIENEQEITVSPINGFTNVNNLIYIEDSPTEFRMYDYPIDNRLIGYSNEKLLITCYVCHSSASIIMPSKIEDLPSTTICRSCKTPILLILQPKESPEEAISKLPKIERLTETLTSINFSDRIHKSRTIHDQELCDSNPNTYPNDVDYCNCRCPTCINISPSSICPLRTK